MHNPAMLLAALTTLAALAGSFGDQIAQPPPSLHLMFFVKGEGARPADADAMKALSATHFANMAKQAEAGRLFAAGPLSDPTTVRRGITVVKLAKRSELEGLFADDEFVKRDIMRVEAAPWDVRGEDFRPAVDPGTVVEHRLVLLRQGPGKSPETAELRAGHARHLYSEGPCLGLAVWGVLGASDDASFQGVREAAIFVGSDTEGIRKMLEADTMVQRRLLEPEILPLWMSQGVVVPRSG